MPRNDSKTPRTIQDLMRRYDFRRNSWIKEKF